MDLLESEKRCECPAKKANFFSRLYCLWTWRVFRQGYHNGLRSRDLYETLSELDSKILGDELLESWEDEKRTSSENLRAPKLRRAIFSCFGYKAVLFGIVQSFFEIVLRPFQAVVLGKFISYFNPNSEMTKIDAYIHALLFLGCAFLYCLGNHPIAMRLQIIGLKVKIACSSLIYRKILKLNNSNFTSKKTDETINFLSAEARCLNRCFNDINFIWISPFKIFAWTYVMFRHVGFAAVPGVMVLLLFFPVQVYFERFTLTIKLNVKHFTIERLTIMSEMISGFKNIKILVWENLFKDLINLVRHKELFQVKKLFCSQGIIDTFVFFNMRLALFATIIVYILLGNDVKAENVFVVVMSVNAIYFIIYSMYDSLASTFDAFNLIGKMEIFLMTKEFEKDRCISNEENKIGIEMRNVSAKWFDDNKNIFENLNIDIAENKIVAVVGPTGGGKSSFLQLILKELPVISGTLNVHGKISYASQHLSIFSGNIRQNILCGLHFDKDRYNNVINCCGLARDFSLFPYEDKTLVGDRGIFLSEAQKARINLARALYHNADIYLLDDLFLALSVKIGREIFTDCINSFLRNKICIFVTQQLKFLEIADEIVLSINGTIENLGTYNDCINFGVDLSEFLYDTKSDEEIFLENVDLEDEEEENNFKSLISTKDLEEEKAFEEIKTRIYKNYFTSGNWLRLLVVPVLFAVTQITGSSLDFFVSFWIILIENQQLPLNEYFPTSFICISIALLLGSIILSFISVFQFYFFCVNSSKNLHEKILNRIVRVPMHFFVEIENNLKKTLSKFSEDLKTIDEDIPRFTFLSCQALMTILGAVTLIGISNVWLLFPTIFVSLLYFGIMHVYVTISPSIKRIENATRNPILAHMKVSSEALVTIRALQAESMTTKKFYRHQNLHTSSWFLYLSTSRIFKFSLDLLVNIYLCIITFIFIFLDKDIFGGIVGLALTQCMILNNFIYDIVKHTTHVKNQMISVERLVQYMQTEKELDFDHPITREIASTWPTDGEIIFSDIYLRYSAYCAPILRKINLHINSQEKIGVIGRPGSGKSSLIAALFRLAYLDGTIYIDKVDIQTLSLYDLRSKLSFLSSEPMIFTGSLRKNLDPFQRYSDDSIWAALDNVEIQSHMELKNGLNTIISKDSLNVEQKQLIGLARAILSNNKIVIIDDITSNVNSETEKLISKIIRENFMDKTLIIISSKLNMVVNTDRILVIDAGQIVEFNHPYMLLQNSNSFFVKMIKKAESAEKEYIYEKAKQNYYF